MTSIQRRRFIRLAAAAAIAPSLVLAAAQAEAGPREAAQLAEDSRVALAHLAQNDEVARAIRDKAVAELVFPRIVKAGLIVGGSTGKGTLFRSGQVEAYYRSVSASIGLQAGAQAFGYALFFMNEEALASLRNADGWELGVGPSLVVVDTGFAARASTATLTQDIYAMIFDQSGLMGGLGVEGSKITRIDP